jgi:hypothetical protein
LSIGTSLGLGEPVPVSRSDLKLIMKMALTHNLALGVKELATALATVSS